MIAQEGRLRSLVETGIALTSELSLDAVLQRLVEAAAEITSARYAALGVIGGSGRELERFLTTGVTDEVVEAIGRLPVGRGLVGALIGEAEPVRLHDLTEDPRSVGFPPGHPPMKTFLGVPIMLRGVAYGNLYLTEKDGGDFTEEDEELVQLLAAQAAVAIENARLYESARRWVRQLELMTEVGNAIASETDLAALLELVARRLRELLGARIVFIALPVGDTDLRVEASAHDGSATGVGFVLSRNESKSGRVLERRQAERVDSLVDDAEFDRYAVREFCDHAGLPTPTTGIFVPLLVQDHAIGVVSIHDRIRGEPDDLRFADEDVRIAEWFAQRAAVAVDLSQRVQRDALRRVVAAQELERKRLARELHDETGQALTTVLLGLRGLEEATTLDDVRSSAAALKELTVQTLQDVRRLAVELRPSALDDFGLVPALERLSKTFSEQTGLVVELEARLAERLPGEIETALYRIVQEALTNAGRHAGARHVSVLLTQKDSTVAAIVEDDGRGFEPGRPGGRGLGLLGMRERLALLDGTLTIESSPGAGTTIVAEARIP